MPPILGFYGFTMLHSELSMNHSHHPGKRFPQSRWPATAALIAALILPSPAAWAQTSEPLDTIIFNAPPPPPEKGTPGGRATGGAGRGSCQDYEALQALVPTVDGTVYSQTAEAFPTFWFYLPTALTSDMSLEFVIQDNNDEFIYATEVTESNIPAGLQQLSVPATAQSLEIDSTYTWTFSIYCEPTVAGTIFVNGTVERVVASESSPSLSDLEQVQHFASQGLWHEALTRVIDLYKSNPDDLDISNIWQSLLEQANVTNVPLEPVSR